MSGARGTAGRWAIGTAAAFVVFWLCLWLARSVSFGWMPTAEADRWAVAGAFAGAMAAAVVAMTAWWAGRGARSGSGRSRDRQVVRQQARASQYAGVEQTAGASGTPGARHRSPWLQRVTQKARASDRAKIKQVGGDRNP